MNLKKILFLVYFLSAIASATDNLEILSLVRDIPTTQDKVFFNPSILKYEKDDVRYLCTFREEIDINTGNIIDNIWIAKLDADFAALYTQKLNIDLPFPQDATLFM